MSYSRQKKIQFETKRKIKEWFLILSWKSFLWSAVHIEFPSIIKSWFLRLVFFQMPLFSAILSKCVYLDELVPAVHQLELSCFRKQSCPSLANSIFWQSTFLSSSSGYLVWAFLPAFFFFFFSIYQWLKKYKKMLKSSLNVFIYTVLEYQNWGVGVFHKNSFKFSLFFLF